MLRILSALCLAPLLMSARAAHSAVLPDGANAWTTLYATFDRDTNAGSTKGNPYASGISTAITAGGVQGNAIKLQDRLATVLYEGYDNLPTSVATVRFYVKSPEGANVWNDGKEYFLAASERYCPQWNGTPTEMAKWPGFSWIVTKNRANELVLGLDNTSTTYIRDEGGNNIGDPLPSGKPMPVSLRLPAATLAGGAWHEVIVSWDVPRRKYWLQVGNKNVAGTLPADYQAGTFAYLIMGNHPSIYTDRQGPFPGSYDELSVSDHALDAWLDANAPREAKRAEAPAPQWPRSEAVTFTAEPLKTYEAQMRTYLDTIARLQNEAGGWCWSYHYPSGMHFLSGKIRTPLTRTRFNNAKDATSSLIAMRFLAAYETLGERKYFDVAKKAVDAVMAGQQPAGWWPHHWDVGPTGVVPYSLEKAAIEDHVQTGPIFLLLYMNRITGEQQYLDRAKRGIEFLIMAQNPQGSWSHHYHLAKKYGESAHGGHRNAGEFNDHTTTEPMAAMLLTYRMTGEKRFLDSYLKAADWVVNAFIDKSATGGAVGWAQQYDAKNVPLWARQFEAPSTEAFASSMAAGELVNAYRLTGDKKYLAPALKWAAWLQKKGSEYWIYHDIETGRPIVAHNYKVYFQDDPAQWAAYANAVLQSGSPLRTDVLRDWVGINQLQKEFAAAAKEAPLPLDKPLPTRKVLQNEAKKGGSTLAGWAKTYKWEYAAYTVSEQDISVPGVRIGAGGNRIMQALGVLLRERALRGDVPMTNPLLHIYQDSLINTVAPQSNLYARLPAK
jgi:hypothetical protein